jgi:hypothetical protein
MPAGQVIDIAPTPAVEQDLQRPQSTSTPAPKPKESKPKTKKKGKEPPAEPNIFDDLLGSS